MIRGYLLALCGGSSLDESTRSFSLFNLIETIGVPPEGLGQTLPFQMHFYCLVEPSARNADFEMRVVRVGAGGASDPGEPLPFHTGDGDHFRLRAIAFRLPKAFGPHLLHVEWRRKGEETWNADPLVWPVLVARLQGPGAEQASANAAS